MTGGNNDYIERERQRMVKAWEVIWRHAQGADYDGVTLEGINIRMPKQKNGEFLVIMKGVTEAGDPMVAFMGGDLVATALYKAMTTWEEGGLRWRLDEWRVQHG